jgi:GNAT superfamily N-acetyltransferase
MRSHTGTEELLRLLDDERRASGERTGISGIVRDRSADGSACQIVHSCCGDHELDAVIQRQCMEADAGGYDLEWKVYGHDRPLTLAERLIAAGFEQGATESVLVLALDDASLAAFTVHAREIEIRRVRDAIGLDHVADIARDVGRPDAEAERQRLARALRHTPEDISVHVAYVDGEPVASGRIHFGVGRRSADLAGGRTRPSYRNRGIFKTLVGSRLREARDRGCTHVFVDALPSSESILRRAGFQLVTSTRPYTRDRRARAKR